MKKSLHIIVILMLVFIELLVLEGCGGKSRENVENNSTFNNTDIQGAADLKPAASGSNSDAEKTDTGSDKDRPETGIQGAAGDNAENTGSTAAAPAQEPAPPSTPQANGSDGAGAWLRGITICIDPGHQAVGNYEPEPIAPESQEMKEKMSVGTSGVATGIPEYRFNLDLSLKLKSALEKLGANVVMTRESNDVNTGNIERARQANESKAGLVLRIHADGLDNRSVSGISVLYPGDKYISDRELLDRSKRAAELVLQGMVGETGAVSRGIVRRDDLTGFNWSTVPVILIEAGFMTNENEDRLLNSGPYQDSLTAGIIKGLEKFFLG